MPQDHARDQKRAIDRFITQQALRRKGSLPKDLVALLRSRAQTRADAVVLLNGYYAERGVLKVKAQLPRTDKKRVPAAASVPERSPTAHGPQAQAAVAAAVAE